MLDLSLFDSIKCPEDVPNLDLDVLAQTLDAVENFTSHITSFKEDDFRIPDICNPSNMENNPNAIWFYIVLCRMQENLCKLVMERTVSCCSRIDQKSQDEDASIFNAMSHVNSLTTRLRSSLVKELDFAIDDININKAVPTVGKSTQEAQLRVSDPDVVAASVDYAKFVTDFSGSHLRVPDPDSVAASLLKKQVDLDLDAFGVPCNLKPSNIVEAKHHIVSLIQPDKVGGFGKDSTKPVSFGNPSYNEDSAESLMQAFDRIVSVARKHICLGLSVPDYTVQRDWTEELDEIEGRMIELRSQSKEKLENSYKALYLLMPDLFTESEIALFE